MEGRLAAGLRSFRFRLRNSISANERLFLPFARARARRRPGRAVVDSTTQLVLEGYPRSANTFAVVAFELAQSEPVRLAHHLHAPAQLSYAARVGIPAILLIRNPRDAVASLVQRAPWVGLSNALQYYQAFYRAVTPHAAQLLVAPFENVVSDFGEVVDQTNHRFGTRFSPFDHTPQNVDRCFRVIEEMNRAKFGGGQHVVEAGVARPSEARAISSEALRSRLDAPDMQAEVDKAQLVFERLCAASSLRPTSA